MKIVISLGGSIIAPSYDKIAVGYIKNLKQVLNKFKFTYYITVGGGKIARLYIDYGKKAKLKDKELDLLGIGVTKVNSLLIKFLFKNAYKEIIDSEEKLKEAIKSNKKYYIISGWKPGNTTDYVAVKVASIVRASFLINISKYCIYTKDPEKYKDAKIIKKATWKKLLKMAKAHKPGENFIFDKKAMELALRKKIKAFFINYDLKNLERLLKGYSFEGSEVE